MTDGLMRSSPWTLPASRQVELEVVLPENMRVREAHDIALELQQKIEYQHYVERCFVVSV
jgi:divalent metal cation (Fe/Co/Zn/Cd) transporter